MFHNSSALHPHGDDLSSENREDNTFIQSRNDGGQDPDQLTPQSVEEGVMEAGDEAQGEPLPPLWLKVQLPTRASFLANGVHQLELVLLYGDLEEHVLMIDIHGPMMELPIQKPSEISITDNCSVPINSSHLSSPPISDPVESFDDPLLTSHPPCSKRFRAPSLLDRHPLVQMKGKAHPCHKCKKKFNHKRSLIAHQRLHDQDPAIRRPFHCVECDKSFTQNSHLTVHVKMVHLRLKQFKCPECDHKFGHKSNLTTHINGVHLGIRHPCRKSNCGKSFSQIGNLRIHEKQAH